jgi:hypothetical protein
MNRINANRNRCRCGYRRLQLYCPESSSIMQVSRPLNYNHGVLNTLPPVPDSYIGTVSSSMFAGMMVGAVGWGTCKSTPNSHIQIISLVRTTNRNATCVISSAQMSSNDMRLFISRFKGSDSKSIISCPYGEMNLMF